MSFMFPIKLTQFCYTRCCYLQTVFFIVLVIFITHVNHLQDCHWFILRGNQHVIAL